MNIRKVRRRKCKICGGLFLPDPRAKRTQKTCADRRCREEWHRRSCREWRAKNPFYYREEGFKKKLGLETLDGIDWDAVKNTFGFELGLFLEQLVTLFNENQIRKGNR
jgi:hypothetical protein